MNKSYYIPLDFVLLIPCYNNFQGLLTSLQSVHYPGYRFSILIVDDGSTQSFGRDDFAGDIPGDYSIDIVRLPLNKGITNALNEGLRWINKNINTRYIARLDCGDTCSEERFIKQVQLLDQQPEINITGSWCYFKNYSTGTRYLYKTPTRHQSIYRGMNFRNMFIHPSVMWRKSAMVENYPSDFPHAEDYGFFYTILQGGKGAIIPEPLVTCEINPKGISLTNRTEQLRSRIKVIKQFSHNKLLTSIGVLKLWVLLAMPYSLILNTKKFLYKQ